MTSRSARIAAAPFLVLACVTLAAIGFSLHAAWAANGENASPPRAEAAGVRTVPTEPTRQQLFDERIRSVVAVEFVVQTEIDRRPSTVIGMVADADGLIVLLDSAIPGWLPPSQLLDFVVYAPGDRVGTPASYLGQDYLTGWHFLRAGEAIRDRLVPATTFGAGVPDLGDEVWGIGLMDRSFNFQPFLMIGNVALVQQLPQRVGFAMDDIASPGAPVFVRDGRLAGWAGASTPQERLLYLENDRYNVRLQNVNGTGSFYLAAEVLPYLDRVPSAPTGQQIPWLGVLGLQPVEAEVAAFLSLGDRSALVVSDVVRDGPAAAAGLKARDILVSLDGEPFPRFSPEIAVTGYLERAVLLRHPGDVMRFGVARGEAREEIAVTLGQQPKALKEAQRCYFERMGFAAREFVLFDRISQRLSDAEEGRLVVHLIKPNSPASAAGLRVGDIIREIDGQPVADYAGAVAALAAIDGDPTRSEFVLYVNRGVETAVIRVRLN